MAYICLGKEAIDSSSLDWGADMAHTDHPLPWARVSELQHPISQREHLRHTAHHHYRL